MKDNRNIMCDQCKKSVPMPDAKYSQKNQDSVMILCSDCKSRDKPKKNKSSQIIKEVERIEEEKQKIVVNPNKKSYNCTRCNYRFKYDLMGENNLRCPYCGKADYLAKSYAFSAEKLIKEVKE